MIFCALQTQPCGAVGSVTVPTAAAQDDPMVIENPDEPLLFETDGAVQNPEAIIGAVGIGGPMGPPAKEKLNKKTNKLFIIIFI